MGEKKVEINTVTYSTMIDVVGKIGKNVKGAKYLFEEMKEKKVEINTVTYNTMIDVVGKIGKNVKGAKDLFEEMKEKKVEINTVTYSTMIDVVGKIGKDVKGAKYLFKEMKEKKVEIDTVTYSTIMNVTKQDAGFVILLFEEMQKAGIPRNGYVCGAALSIRGKPDVVRRFAEKILDDLINFKPHIRSRGWQIIVQKLQKALGKERLETLFVQLDLNPPSFGRGGGRWDNQRVSQRWQRNAYA